MENKRFIEVAPSLPLHKTLYYHVPKNLRQSMEPGKRVLIPLGKRKITGYVVGFPQKVRVKEIKDVLDILDISPLFNRDELGFYHWVSNYYFSSLGEVIKTALPQGINIETLQTLSLTKKGTDLLASYDDNQLTSNILTEIGQKKEVSLKYIVNKFSADNPYALLFRLRDEGLINIEFKEKRKRVCPKTEAWVQQEIDALPTEDLTRIIGTLERNAPKQTAILKHLLDKNKVPIHSLRKEFSNPWKSLRGLEEKGLISITQEEVYRDPFGEEKCSRICPPILERRQEAVLNRVIQGIKSEKFSPFLLYGVTGSGKTEIYLRAVEEVLQLGKEAIILVPEISLTAQLLSRFRSRFGNNIALFHSRLSEGERYDQWRRIHRKEVKVAIGVRSAIFVPFENLGVIVVDEEHDTSYKQDERLRYSARDLALVRGKLTSSAVILGSATPSLESYYNSQTGKFVPLSLPTRIENRPLPSVEIVDMRQEVRRGFSDCFIFSRKLIDAIEETLLRKEQILLFLNRRGFASFILCERCGSIIKCPNCSVSLVYHLNVKSLYCHYCDYSMQVPDRCPECNDKAVRSFGLGTESVALEVKKVFPNARVARMDRDTTTRKNSHHRILKSLENGEVDILIGTQMITKGHDLSRVTLVGVVSADTSLGFPDFRASERTFQLLTQVAGRAGRGDLPGRVIIQTFNPGHYSIQQAKSHNFIEFYKEEINFRRELNYPPFSRLVNFRILGNDRKKTKEYADELEEITKDLLERNEKYRSQMEFLGPVVAPLEKLRGKYRWQMMVKGQNPDLLHSFGKEMLQKSALRIKGKGVTLSIDVDPINML
ncbi:MAG: primosomal protein N' [Thermodesulfobacteriota bacterium]|nr:primosomal protein N' [Thermodesulfobacteriota bacterium]